MDTGEPCGKGSDTMNKTISLKMLLLILMIIVVVVAGGIGVLYHFNTNKETANQLTDQRGSKMFLPDANAEEGGLDGESLTEMYHEMLDKAEKGNIIVNFSETILLNSGSTEAEVQIANPVENNTPMQFVISLADTGEKVYESGLIPLGSHITTAEFTRNFEPGEYPAVLTYNAIDEESSEIVSYVSVSVTITVE